jgi:hypothetical protein
MNGGMGWNPADFRKFRLTGIIDGGVIGTEPPPPKFEDAVAYFLKRDKDGLTENREDDIKAATRDLSGAFKREELIKARKEARVTGPVGRPKNPG